MNLRDRYSERLAKALPDLAAAVETRIKEYLKDTPRIDRVAARAKSLERFLAKAEALIDGKPKYGDPINEIQDQIGARIITFYPSDVAPISEMVTKYFRPVETQTLVPEREWEFGYFGKHFILLIPDDLVDGNIAKNLAPEFFELQIKTLFQHAWSEANHDLGYKPGSTPLTSDEKRRLAYTSAQAWGADRMFDELYRERSQQMQHPP